MHIERIAVGSLAANCYILADNGEAAVVDPGDDCDRILAALKRSKAKLKYIINTHYHFDHTTATRELQNSVGGEILIHEDDKDFIDYNADRLLADGDILYVGSEEIRVIHTPGHTAGGICLLGDGWILTGDTLFRDGYGRTDLPGGSDERLAASLKLLKGIIKPGMTVYPGHGEEWVG